jgi:hypothetical protein
MTSREVVHDIITRHSTPTVAPSREVFLQAKHSHVKTIYIASLSILILSKTYPSQKKLPLDMQGFWLVGLFCQKVTNIIDPYFQYFSSSSNALITITK